MRLEHHDSPSASIRLTPDELNEVMERAIRSEGEAERAREQATTYATVEDALEIARQLNIPEEHVLAALEQRKLEKVRELKRRAALARRRQAAIPAAVFSALAGGALLMGFAAGLPSALVFPLLLMFGIPALLLWLRGAGKPGEAEIERTELAPVPGKCRVCWSDAFAPNATFCEEHRYRGPG